jgi:inhibitor of cysteine peptidase
MARLILASGLTLVALLVPAGCGDDSGEESSTTTSTAADSQTFTDPKGPIEVVAESEFEIVLDSNPSTGYSWKLAKPLKGGIVEYVDSKYEPDTGSEDQVGSGGTEALRFRALESGEATIELEYVGPGSDAKVGSRRSIQVTVG